MNKSQYKMVRGALVVGICAGFAAELQHSHHSVFSDVHGSPPALVSMNPPLPHLPHVEYDSQTYLLNCYYNQTGVGHTRMITGIS
jgi:hypothetical protein